MIHIDHLARLGGQTGGCGHGKSAASIDWQADGIGGGGQRGEDLCWVWVRVWAAIIINNNNAPNSAPG